MSATRVTIGDTPAAEPVRLAIGQVIGRYRVDAILGTGGMGTVARARDLDLDRDVALKVAVFADAATARSRAERLLREAQSMARLRARNVRAVHDVGSANGIDFVAMEYIAGTDLAGWLATPRSVTDIARVFAAAGNGLAAAHDAGIVHRDVKPSNVLVGDDGEVVVTDFGLAQWMHEPARAGGTPGYIAPDAEPDALSDQYSFSVALAESLPASAAALHAIAARGSKASPAERYPSMHAVVAAIERASRPRGRWPFVIAAAVVAVSIATVLWWPRAASDPVDDPDIARIHDLADHGFLKTARSQAERLVASGRPELRAAASFELGYVALYQNDTETARSALAEANRLADAAKDDRTRARADIALLLLATARGSDLAAINRAEATAVASSSRVELDRSTRANLRYMQAMATIARGDQAAGRQGLAEARQIATPPDLAGLVTWAEIVRTQVKFSDPRERLAMLRELVATTDSVGGAAHMESISARGELAMALEDAGQLDDAARTMAEMRAAGATPDGQRLLAEIGSTPVTPTHVMTVAVRDNGKPVPGATVVGATMLRGNARYLVGAIPLYAERERQLVVATTDAAGVASLRVPDTGKIWIAAEHGERGRAVPIEIAAAGTRAELELAGWGRLAGVASGRVRIVSASRPDGPQLDVETNDRGELTVDRLAYGRYIVTACTTDEVSTCRAERVVIGPATPPVDVKLPPGDAELVVRVRDELQRPIESSVVVVAPADFTPASMTAFEGDWMTVLADRPGAIVAWGNAHDTRPAKFDKLPRGRYTLCAAALHGDTEDPAFTAKLEARTAPVPIFCEPIELAGPTTDLPLVVPAASRVWLP